MENSNVKWVRLGDYIEQCDERNTISFKKCSSDAQLIFVKQRRDIPDIQKARCKKSTRPISARLILANKYIFPIFVNTLSARQ